MKTCLLVVNRPFLSDFDSLYGQVIHLKDKYDKVILLHPYKTNKVVEHIPIRVDESVRFDEDISKAYEKSYTTWIDYYNDISLLKDIKIDDIWIFGGSLSEGSKLKRRWPDQLDRCLDKHDYMFYISVCKLYVTQYLVLKIANWNDAQIYEVCYDPGEFSLAMVKDERIKPKKDVIVYHGYDIPEFGIKRLDSFQEYLLTTSITYSMEYFDFVFGYSYITKERKLTHDTIQEIYNSLDSKYEKLLFVKNKIDEINTFIPRNEYLRYIHNSDFTLIMPAYEKDCFSIYRLLESVHHDCIPLIHESCFVKDVEDSYDIDLSPYIISNTNINDAMSMNRDAGLKYLKDKLFK